MSQELEKIIIDWLYSMERLAILGIGNSLKCDDALGLEIVRRLKGRLGNNILLIESETIPESYAGPVVSFKPTHILFVDAAQLNRDPGFICLVKSSEIAGIPLSTHALPLSIFANYLESLTNARLALLGVQPKCLEFGERLSDEVKEAVEKVSDLLLKLLPVE